MQRRIEAGHVGLDDAMRDAGREQVQRARRCASVPSPASCAGSAAPGAQIGAHEQRIEHARGGAGIGESLVAARRHARQREGGAAEQARDGRRLVDVVARIAPHALGVAAEHLVHAAAGDVLALGAGDAGSGAPPL